MSYPIELLPGEPDIFGEWSAAQQAESEAALNRQLDSLSIQIPEIEENRSCIAVGGHELLEGLQISPELFLDDAHTLFFAALAQRNAALERERESMTIDAYTGEKEFIFGAAMMLALNRSGLFDQFRTIINQEDIYTEEQLEAAYDRYTNVQITVELQQAIDDGLLDEVKRRMGITADNEDPYVLHVLNIGDSRTFYGMAPDVSNELLAYKAGLAAKTKEFMAATGAESVPRAWVIRLKGRNHLNITLPNAEKILYPEEARSASYDSEQRRLDIATLEHEFAHTQGGLGLDAHIYYGVALEERRAELMAGDKMGYNDAK
ncbi:MAG: hypothetical protein AAB834_04050, partial [Patescibacteria group bacterium]